MESIELLDLHPDRLAANALAVSGNAIERASRELRRHQRLMHETGGIHAAAR
ncbi:hypothetical protein EHZ19_15915 [Paraburkholderia bannensis]|nr:hypothetical protein EHZ19_15915 [Paraburkholderia bannensis]